MSTPSDPNGNGSTVALRAETPGASTATVPQTQIARPVFGDNPPHDGRHWDAQCARCGSDLDWEECNDCGGEGRTAPGELHEEDPLWYDPGDTRPCYSCGGKASWPWCLSSPEWCNANPLKGREAVERNTPEWFVVGIPES